MTLSRRELLARGAAGAGVLAVGNLTGLFRAAPAFGANGPGPLVPDPNALLDLPADFSYKVLSRTGDPMTGGTVPGSHDGAAAFAGPSGNVHIVLNHERGLGTSIAPPELTYDPALGGGTTTLVVGPDNSLIEQYASLGGTNSNCAGGLTPWGTWLTCEENESRAGSGGRTKDHGFVFEVDPVNTANNLTPTPLTGLGRFAHEATCTDPETGEIYLTEDASGPNGLVYRFRPNDMTPEYGALREGGTLTAMRCSLDGVHVPDLARFTEIGTTLKADWVPVPDPLAATTSIRKQFANSEVTRSRKFEGAWWGDADRRAHIVCSYARLSDGSSGEHDGQVWAYDPDARTLKLEVRFGVNPDYASHHPDGPDNITVSPYGGLFLAEDGDGLSHLLAVSKSGKTTPFALNRLNESEFAGVCFSPDGRTMFVGIQSPGISFAITGPFVQVTRG